MSDDRTTEAIADRSELPDWWRDAIEEFQTHELKPYHPPQFSDGVFRHEVVEDLETEFDIDIRFLSMNPQYGGDWSVQIDGEAIGTIPRYRHPDGYSVFEIESNEFAAWIRELVE